MVTDHFVEVSLLHCGPMSSRPSLTTMPSTAQHFPPGPEMRSQRGVPLIPPVRVPQVLKFSTWYWSGPGLLCAPVHATAACPVALHRLQVLPPSMGSALDPLISMSDAIPVFLTVIG